MNEEECEVLNSLRAKIFVSRNFCVSKRNAVIGTNFAEKTFTYRRKSLFLREKLSRMGKKKKISFEIFIIFFALFKVKTNITNFLQLQTHQCTDFKGNQIPFGPWFHYMYCKLSSRHYRRSLAQGGLEIQCKFMAYLACKNAAINADCALYGIGHRSL